jgi:hypothetical protein
MLSDRERQEVEAQVNRDCAQFEIIMTDIIDAGFDGSNPFLWLHDADGRPWHKAPYKMSPADIETYVRHRFPEIFLTFLRALPVMTVH